MIDARLELALGGGGLTLPETGDIAVFRPSVDADLTDLPPERCHIIHDFKPFHDQWKARGYEVSHDSERRYCAAIVCLPRSKSEARALIALACSVSDGPVVIDGQKTDGADSILKEMRKRVTVSDPISKAHGKLFWIDAPVSDFFTDWVEPPALSEGGYWTAPGVFAAGGVDLASALVVDALPDDLGKHVVDLGAGWGFLSAHILTRQKIETLHLVEAGHLALECARRNVTDPRAVFQWEDATAWDPKVRIDSVVMNPPFHQGRAAEPQIGQAFVASAARLLSGQGKLWMVANRHLPYEVELRKHFAHVQEIGGDARFKLFHAARPVKRRR